MYPLSKYKILLNDVVCAPLADLQRLEGEDFGQNIWDYSKLLLGTLGERFGTFGNILGTHAQQE
jgi:hypothetical protein